jgi:hypothetical protein
MMDKDEYRDTIWRSLPYDLLSLVGAYSLDVSIYGVAEHLRSCCEDEDITTAQWLLRHYDITNESRDIKISILSVICKTGNMRLAKSVIPSLDLVLKESEQPKVLQLSYKRVHISFLKWLICEGYLRDNAHESPSLAYGRILTLAIKYNTLCTFKWVYRRLEHIYHRKRLICAIMVINADAQGITSRDMRGLVRCIQNIKLTLITAYLHICNTGRTCIAKWMARNMKFRLPISNTYMDAQNTSLLYDYIRLHAVRPAMASWLRARYGVINDFDTLMDLLHHVPSNIYH